MLKPTLAALLIFLLSGPAVAGYRFDVRGDYLADASALPAWAPTLERHATDQDAIRRCLAREDACEKPISSRRCRTTSWQIPL